jgi:hypothetical protein
MTRTSKSAFGVIDMSEGNRGSHVPDHQPTNETNRVTHLTTPTDIDRWMEHSPPATRSPG